MYIHADGSLRYQDVITWVMSLASKAGADKVGLITDPMSSSQETGAVAMSTSEVKVETPDPHRGPTGFAAAQAGGPPRACRWAVPDPAYQRRRLASAVALDPSRR